MPNGAPGGEQRAIAATSAPATAASLVTDLRRLGVQRGDVVVVHGSLSALGWVAGGAQAMVEALLEAIGPNGTMVMPSQSGQLSDPAQWQNPPLPEHWIAPTRDALPAFDRDRTGTRGMGAICDCFRTDRRSRRSGHPLLSFVALGPDAEHIVDPHPIDDAFGETSPLARLYDRDASIVLLGVDHATTTAMHLAEHRATWPGRSHATFGAPMMVDGARQWVGYEALEYDESDFATIGQHFGAAGGEQQSPVGAGIGRRCSLRAIVDFAADWITEHRA